MLASESLGNCLMMKLGCENTSVGTTSGFFLSREVISSSDVGFPTVCLNTIG